MPSFTTSSRPALTHTDDPYPTVWAALDAPSCTETDGEHYGRGWHESSQDLRRGLIVEEVPFTALASLWSAFSGGLAVGR